MLLKNTPMHFVKEQNMAKSMSDKLDQDDLEILIESLGFWESSENGFLDFVKRLRMLGSPPEEFIEDAPEGFANWWAGFTKEMFSRERSAKDKQKERMEKACLVKAKLIMKRREELDSLADDLFFGSPKEVKEIESEEAKEIPPTASPKKPDSPRQTHGKDKSE